MTEWSLIVKGFFQEIFLISEIMQATMVKKIKITILFEFLFSGVFCFVFKDFGAGIEIAPVFSDWFKDFGLLFH